MEKVKRAILDVSRGEKLLTIQPGGNNGDTLIYMGANKYISKIDVERIPFGSGDVRSDAPRPFPSANLIRNLQYLGDQSKYISHRALSQISAIYIHGGGNFNDIWGGSIACYLTAARYFDCPIIIGPQTCKFSNTDPREIFRKTNNETHLFCRERYSYEDMSDISSDFEHVNLHLDDDTALSLTADDLPVEEFSGDYTLVAFRTDKVSDDPTITSRLKPPIKVQDISITSQSFKEFVNIVANASYIHTDRLHVAILSNILNKNTSFYNVNYHKNMGVYEQSLESSPNINFIE